jgi:hypothetical protein
MGTWAARTTKELLDYMSGAMPPGGPSLPAETYASIAAYILQSNGAVAGPEALSASTAARIGSLTAVSPAPARPATPSRGSAPAGSTADGNVSEGKAPSR